MSPGSTFVGTRTIRRTLPKLVSASRMWNLRAWLRACSLLEIFWRLPETVQIGDDEHFAHH